MGGGYTGTRTDVRVEPIELIVYIWSTHRTLRPVNLYEVTRIGLHLYLIHKQITFSDIFLITGIIL